MSEPKHTPGQWQYQENSDAYTHIVRADNNRFLCQLAQDTSGEAEANARLIAAAPELLAACLQAVKALENVEGSVGLLGGERGRLRQLRAAITKATEPTP